MLDTTRLDLLLADLRHAGLVVGVTEMDRLHRVFSQLDGGDGAATSTRLRSLIAAVLVKRRDQQTAFDDAFTRWQQRAEADLESLSAPAPLLSSRPLRQTSTPPDPRRRHRLRWPTAVLTGFLALASVGLGGAIVQLQSGYDDLLAGLQGPPAEPETPPPAEPETSPPAEPETSPPAEPETSPPAEPETSPPAEPETPPLPVPPLDEEVPEAPLRERTFTYYRPELTVQTESVLEPEPETLGLLAACLATLWVLWRRPSKPALQAQVPAEPSSDALADRGPPRVLLPPPPGADLHLLTRGQREMMVWGLDHYVAEGERSHHLDVPASVDATARAGGLLQLYHRPPRHPREVWLWLDNSCEDPTAAQLADEVQGALEAQRLPVRRATFWGLPDPLTDADGAVFRPREMEEHRQRARIVLLTDGRHLRQQSAQGDRRGHLTARLRELSHWPRLAIVDFSTDDNFGHLLRRHHIERLAPDALPGFVGGIVTSRTPRQATAEALWTAATALCPAPFEAGTARALADHLGLTVSPWALRQMRRLAPGPGERLEWTRQDRVDQLEWLRTVESQVDDDETFQQQAVRFWLRHYDTELARRNENADWLESRAAHLLQAERWLVALFRPAERTDAIARLWRLFRGSRTVAPWIEKQLASITTLDDGRPGLARLSFRRRELHPVEYRRLLHMGLAPVPQELHTRPPARRRLAIGLAAGLTLGNLVWEIIDRQPDFVMYPESKSDASLSMDQLFAASMGFVEVGTWRQDLSDGDWRGVVSQPQGQTELTVPADTWWTDRYVDVSWQEVDNAPCVDTSTPGLEVWRCQPKNRQRLMRTVHRLGTGRTTRIAAGLISPLAVPEVEDFASVLLDSGSADIVLIGEDRQLMEGFGAPDEVEGFFPLYLFDPNLLFFLWSPGPSSTESGMWTSLANAVRQLRGRANVSELWQPVDGLDGMDLEEMSLLGLADIPPVPMEMVPISGGTFWMGTREDDPGAEMAYENQEQPAQEETVEGFWMGKTEVTHAQYKQLHPDHTTYWDEQLKEDTDDLPVTDVTWHDAKAFCEALGYRLPTEAEWEYAARARTRTPWSHGDSESQLGEYAWFDEGRSGSVHAIGTKLANPWGLHDMHGNAWEWVDDEYVSYEDGKPIKGRFSCKDDTKCSVLRGGSYWGEPRDVRSADRFWFKREDPHRRIGFRCVRGLPPALFP